MALISRNDLHYTDYDWFSNPTVEPRFHGPADNNAFDKTDGNDVLYVINEYADENDIRDKKHALKLEREIRQHMAKDISTQRDVMDWLKSIFRK
ncbi:MAG TPA: hypothetical protein VFG39_09210 [Balneolaceae bacterium]|nr:hypothetical protein [Balneolaceae bacterium]